MKKISLATTINFNLPLKKISLFQTKIEELFPYIIVLLLTLISLLSFWHYHTNGLALAYNDARSHLDISRRVVEGLKPGLAQLGSVWLPLPHILMIPTIWNDYFWHTGLSGALNSMISFVVTALVIEQILKLLKVKLLGRIVGIVLFVVNVNILYLQATAMTELLLLATMTGGVYYLIKWSDNGKLLDLIKTATLIMLSTLVRYDGWMLLLWSAFIVFVWGWKKGKYRQAEGMFILFCTLAGLGIILWLLWNAIIFKDPLYFIFGPFSAHAQQAQLNDAGVLLTKGNIELSTKIYWLAMVYNSVLVTVLTGMAGLTALLFDKKISREIKIASTALLAPLAFNILALYLGHSVLFIQGVSGNTWFNVRYGIMMLPSLAVGTGYLIDRIKNLKIVLIGILCLTLFFHVVNSDAVTIDDGRVGSSQKNVSEVSGWLRRNAADQPDYILISAASHDAIIFSSGLPMKRFIHEGTGAYWESATTAPDRWARWIIMRTHDNNDLTFKLVNQTNTLEKYDLVESLPFADIYQLKDHYVPNLETRQP